jgi:glutathione S-transferase/GST-like protein
MFDVYHWEPNSHQAKPMIVLFEKGVPFVSHYVDIMNLEHVAPGYLAICSSGQVPAMFEDGRLLHPAQSLSETTDFCEYVDERFPDPPLRPSNAEERWRMRWWCAFMDHYFAPSLSILAWKSFMGPAVRERHSMDALEAFLKRIPSPDTFKHWNTAIHDLFTEEQLSDSRRRIAEGIKRIEAALARRPYLAGSSYSIADIVNFATIYAFPLGNPELSDESKTPHFFDWLRRIHVRPAIKKTFALSRMRFAERIRQMHELLGLE